MGKKCTTCLNWTETHIQHKAKQVKSSQVFGGNKIGTNSEYAPNSSFFLEMQLILLTNEYWLSRVLLFLYSDLTTLSKSIGKVNLSFMGAECHSLGFLWHSRLVCPTQITQKRTFHLKHFGMQPELQPAVAIIRP